MLPERLPQRCDVNRAAAPTHADVNEFTNERTNQQTNTSTRRGLAGTDEQYTI